MPSQAGTPGSYLCTCSAPWELPALLKGVSMWSSIVSVTSTGLLASVAYTKINLARRLKLIKVEVVQGKKKISVQKAFI